MAGRVEKVVVVEGVGASAKQHLLVDAHLGRFVVERVSWRGAERASLSHAAALIAEVMGDAGPVLAWLEARRSALPTIALLSADLSPEHRQRAAAVADDFAIAPLHPWELDVRVARLIAARQGQSSRVIARRLARDLGLDNMVGTDPSFRRLLGSLPRVAASDATVLITGETGTGKELYARALHHLSPRHDRPFVAVDCGAFPEHLLENELFGHAAGAFTDARNEHKGLARMAEGGVLFLDEVDGLSLPAQGKLLRFLQERTFKPLGEERPREADVRIVAASNRDLGALVKAQRFRADLYFRLSVLLVHVMPLRERPSDIPLLATHFLERCAAGPEQGQARRFSEAALDLLGAHDFPGNVRELCNLVQRAAVMVESDVIDVADLLAMTTLRSAASVAGRPTSRSAGASFRDAKARAVEEFERVFVADLLRRHRGNITRASREAGKDRRAFGRLVKKHGLEGAAIEAPAVERAG